MSNSEDEDYVPESDAAEIIEMHGDEDGTEMDGDSGQEVDEDGQEDDIEMDQDGDDELVELKDDSVQGFFAHGEESVYSVAISPVDPNLVCSGGGDDHAYLWRCDDGETVCKYEGFSDSVVSVQFSHDGKYIATGAMDGVIKVWAVATGELTATLEGPDELVWCRWHPRGHVLIAGASDGTLWMWHLPTGNVMNVFSGGHSASLSSGMFSPDGKHIVTSSEDGSLAMWDPKNMAPIWKLTANDGRWHRSAITAFAISADSTLIASGDEEGGVRIVSLQSGKITSAIDAHGDAVEAVSFCKIMPLLATASMDGTIKVWDLNTMSLRTTCQHNEGVTQAQFSDDSPYLVSASADRTVRIWDARTADCLQVWHGHHDTILAMALADNGTVITGGDDGVLLVFRPPQQ